MSLDRSAELARYQHLQNFAVLFSGGLDSTAVALLIGPRVKGTTHLLTYYHHYGTFFNDWSKKHIPELRRVVGEDKVFHNLLDIHSFYDEIAVSTLIRDFFKYRDHFNVCLGCQQAMAARTIIHCLEYNITNAFICSSVGGEYAAMSMPMTRDRNTDFYLRYGIRYDAPLLRHNIAKPEERELLASHNIHPGYGFRRSVQGYQPVCVLGFQHGMDILFDLHTTYRPNRVEAFLDEKFLIMEKIIERWFEQKGIALQPLIDANLALYQAEQAALDRWEREYRGATAS